MEHGSNTDFEYEPEDSALVLDSVDGHFAAEQTVGMPNITCQHCNAAIINVPAERIGKDMTVTCAMCHEQTATLPSAEEIILMRLERIDRRIAFIYLAMRIAAGLALLCAAFIAVITVVQALLMWQR